MKKYSLLSLISSLITNSIIILLLLLVFISAIKIDTFALSVNQDPIGIYCIKDNGQRAIGEWVLIDFEGDGYYEWYYFDINGYLILNGFTPDGYIVNEKGQWVSNGVVQRKHYKSNDVDKNIKNINNNTIHKKNQYSHNESNGIIILVLIIIIVLILLFGYILNDNVSNKYKDNYYNNKNKTKFSNDTTVDRNIWWHFRSDTYKKGQEGEDLVARILKEIENGFIVLRNVNLPRKNNFPVQIDFLCISNNGIFVIEVKNWLGIIIGDYDDVYWHSKIYDIDNYQKNPIKQNEWHIDVLKRIVKKKYSKTHINYYSIVVFTNRAELYMLKKQYHETYITNIDSLNYDINCIYRSHSFNNNYTNNEYKSIADYLSQFVDYNY